MKNKIFILCTILTSLISCGTPSPSSSSASSVSSTSSSITSSSSSSTNSSVIADSLVLAVNVGSATPASYNGVQYSGDRFASGGTQGSTSDPIAGTDEDSLFQSERYGTYSYNIPVTNATYRVVLHFAEMYQENAGLRTFNVNVEGQQVISGLDVFSEVGHDTAYSQSFSNIQVTDEKLTIALESVTDNATLSGFAIYSSNGGQYLEPVSNGSTVCPTDGPCKILPFGDSITDGVGVSGGGGYRIELFKRAVEAGNNITFVGAEANGPTTVAGKPFPRNHQGHSGWTIETVNGQSGISTKIPSPALNDNPNIILLHIGTNDVYQQPSGMDVRLGRLIDKILDAAPDALLVVASIIPSTSSFVPNSVIVDYNAKIPAIVQQRAEMGFKIIFLDQYAGFPGASELADGIHPNTAGYARMGAKWYDAIKEYLP